jgi:hypothetical protein
MTRCGRSLVPLARCGGRFGGARVRCPGSSDPSRPGTVFLMQDQRSATAPMALPLSTPAVTTSDTDPYRLAPHRIKRCTYRRLISLDQADERLYEVECLFPDRRIPMPLGDLDSAMPICNACTAPHIFRPDED